MICFLLLLICPWFVAFPVALFLKQIKKPVISDPIMDELKIYSAWAKANPKANFSDYKQTKAPTKTT
jgi:hypothetical protein